MSSSANNGKGRETSLIPVTLSSSSSSSSGGNVEGRHQPIPLDTASVASTTHFTRMVDAVDRHFDDEAEDGTDDGRTTRASLATAADADQQQHRDDAPTSSFHAMVSDGGNESRGDSPLYRRLSLSLPSRAGGGSSPQPRAHAHHDEEQQPRRRSSLAATTTEDTSSLTFDPIFHSFDNTANTIFTNTVDSNGFLQQLEGSASFNHHSRNRRMSHQLQPQSFHQQQQQQRRGSYANGNGADNRDNSTVFTLLHPTNGGGETSSPIASPPSAVSISCVLDTQQQQNAISNKGSSPLPTVAQPQSREGLPPRSPQQPHLAASSVSTGGVAPKSPAAVDGGGNSTTTASAPPAGADTTPARKRRIVFDDDETLEPVAVVGGGGNTNRQPQSQPQTQPSVMISLAAEKDRDGQLTTASPSSTNNAAGPTARNTTISTAVPPLAPMIVHRRRVSFEGDAAAAGESISLLYQAQRQGNGGDGVNDIDANSHAFGRGTAAVHGVSHRGENDDDADAKVGEKSTFPAPIDEDYAFPQEGDDDDDDDVEYNGSDRQDDDLEEEMREIGGDEDDSGRRQPNVQHKMNGKKNTSTPTSSPSATNGPLPPPPKKSGLSFYDIISSITRRDEYLTEFERNCFVGKRAFHNEYCKIMTKLNQRLCVPLDKKGRVEYLPPVGYYDLSDVERKKNLKLIRERLAVAREKVSREKQWEKPMRNPDRKRVLKRSRKPTTKGGASKNKRTSASAAAAAAANSGNSPSRNNEAKSGVSNTSIHNNPSDGDVAVGDGAEMVPLLTARRVYEDFEDIWGNNNNLDNSAAAADLDNASSHLEGTDPSLHVCLSSHHHHHNHNHQRRRRGDSEDDDERESSDWDDGHDLMSPDEVAQFRADYRHELARYREAYRRIVKAPVKRLDPKACHTERCKQSRLVGTVHDDEDSLRDVIDGSAPPRPPPKCSIEMVARVSPKTGGCCGTHFPNPYPSADVAGGISALFIPCPLYADYDDLCANCKVLCDASGCTCRSERHSKACKNFFYNCRKGETCCASFEEDYNVILEKNKCGVDDQFAAIIESEGANVNKGRDWALLHALTSNHSQANNGGVKGTLAVIAPHHSLTYADYLVDYSSSVGGKISDSSSSPSAECPPIPLYSPMSPLMKRSWAASPSSPLLTGAPCTSVSPALLSRRGGGNGSGITSPTTTASSENKNKKTNNSNSHFPSSPILSSSQSFGGSGYYPHQHQQSSQFTATTTYGPTSLNRKCREIVQMPTVSRRTILTYGIDMWFTLQLIISIVCCVLMLVFIIRARESNAEIVYGVQLLEKEVLLEQDKIISELTWYNFIEKQFLPVFTGWGPSSSSTTTDEFTNRNLLFGEFLPLTPIELSAHHVKAVVCPSADYTAAFSSLNDGDKHCYPAYSSKNKETMPTDFRGMYSLVEDESDDEFKNESCRGWFFVGQINTYYDCDRYAVTIPYNMTANQSVAFMKELRAHRLAYSPSARLTALKTVLYHPELNYIFEFVMAYEISEVGAFLRHFNVFPVPLSSLRALAIVSMIVAGIVFLTLLSTWLWNFRNLWHLMPAAEFFGAGEVVQILIEIACILSHVALFVVALFFAQPLVDGVNAMLTSYVSNALQTLPSSGGGGGGSGPYSSYTYESYFYDTPTLFNVENPEFQWKLQRLARIEQTVKILCLVCIVLIFLRLVPFTSIFTSVHRVTLTISNVAARTISLLIIFFIIIMGFSLGGVILFGQNIMTFRSFGAAIGGMFDMLLGQVDYSSMFTVDTPGAFIFVLLFFVIGTCIFLNFIIAILTDSLYETRLPPHLSVADYVWIKSNQLYDTLKEIKSKSSDGAGGGGEGHYSSSKSSHHHDGGGAGLWAVFKGVFLSPHVSCFYGMSKLEAKRRAERNRLRSEAEQIRRQQIEEMQRREAALKSARRRGRRGDGGAATAGVASSSPTTIITSPDQHEEDNRINLEDTIGSSTAAATLNAPDSITATNNAPDLLSMSQRCGGGAMSYNNDTFMATAGGTTVMMVGGADDDDYNENDDNYRKTDSYSKPDDNGDDDHTTVCYTFREVTAWARYHESPDAPINPKHLSPFNILQLKAEWLHLVLMQRSLDIINGGRGGMERDKESVLQSMYAEGGGSSSTARGAGGIGGDEGGMTTANSNGGVGGGGKSSNNSGNNHNSSNNPLDGGEVPIDDVYQSKTKRFFKAKLIGDHMVHYGRVKSTAEVIADLSSRNALEVRQRQHDKASAVHNNHYNYYNHRRSNYHHDNVEDYGGGGDPSSPTATTNLLRKRSQRRRHSAGGESEFNNRNHQQHRSSSCSALNGNGGTIRTLLNLNGTAASSAILMNPPHHYNNDGIRASTASSSVLGGGIDYDNHDEEEYHLRQQLLGGYHNHHCGGNYDSNSNRPSAATAAGGGGIIRPFTSTGSSIVEYAEYAKQQQKDENNNGQVDDGGEGNDNANGPNGKKKRRLAANRRVPITCYNVDAAGVFDPNDHYDATMPFIVTSQLSGAFGGAAFAPSLSSGVFSPAMMPAASGSGASSKRKQRRRLVVVPDMNASTDEDERSEDDGVVDDDEDAQQHQQQGSDGNVTSRGRRIYPNEPPHQQTTEASASAAADTDRQRPSSVGNVNNNANNGDEEEEQLIGKRPPKSQHHHQKAHRIVPNYEISNVMYDEQHRRQRRHLLMVQQQQISRRHNNINNSVNNSSNKLVLTVPSTDEILTRYEKMRDDVRILFKAYKDDFKGINNNSNGGNGNKHPNHSSTSPHHHHHHHHLSSGGAGGRGNSNKEERSSSRSSPPNRRNKSSDRRRRRRSTGTTATEGEHPLQLGSATVNTLATTTGQRRRSDADGGDRYISDDMSNDDDPNSYDLLDESPSSIRLRGGYGEEEETAPIVVSADGGGRSIFTNIASFGARLLNFNRISGEQQQTNNGVGDNGNGSDNDDVHSVNMDYALSHPTARI